MEERGRILSTFVTQDICSMRSHFTPVKKSTRSKIHHLFSKNTGLASEKNTSMCTYVVKIII
jgi:hypothetical protein